MATEEKKPSGPDLSAGIPAADLFAVAFDERCCSRNTLKVHVCQINELIEDTGYRIVALGGFYRLVRQP